MKLCGIIILFIAGLQLVICDDGELFRWTVMEYLSLPRAPTYKIRDHDYYIPQNIIPTGITPGVNRLYVSIARKDYGIPSTLNYIDLRAARNQKSPMLRSYPNYEVNELHNDLRPDSNRIVSVYRTRIDECNRLWFVDTGVLEIKDHNTFIQDPSIWVIDLRNDKVLRRFELVNSLNEMAAGLQSITVDVERTRCDDAFAYIPNSRSNQMIVYSFKEDAAWAFNDSTFMSNEQLSTLKINKEEYEVNEGLYSIALGPRNLFNRTRLIYYHPLASFYEFSVSNRVLKSKELSQRDDHLLDFTYLGTRGDNTQSGIHDLDPRTRVLFTTQVQKSAISCWNIDKLLTPHNVATVAQNSSTLIYPSDLKVYGTNVWYLSNQQPVLEKNGMDTKKYHFYVFKRSARLLIDGTICQSTVLSTTPDPNSTTELEDDDDSELSSSSSTLGTANLTEQVSTESITASSTTTSQPSPASTNEESSSVNKDDIKIEIETENDENLLRNLPASPKPDVIRETLKNKEILKKKLVNANIDIKVIEPAKTKIDVKSTETLKDK